MKILYISPILVAILDISHIWILLTKKWNNSKSDFIVHCLALNRSYQQIERTNNSLLTLLVAIVDDLCFVLLFLIFFFHFAYSARIKYTFASSAKARENNKSISKMTTY